MEKALSFYPTIGNPPETTLTIDRTCMLDLSYFFDKIFSEITGGTSFDPNLWELSEKKAVSKFNLEKLLGGLLNTYDPKELASFLRNHADMEDYHNESLIKRLESFDENYERILEVSRRGRFYLGPLFFEDSVWEEVQKIESVVKPLKFKWYSGFEKDWYFWKHETAQKKYNLTDKERGITRLYNINFRERILKKLGESRGKPLFTVAEEFDLPNLDYFSIIRECSEMPTDHLEIVRKSD